MKKTYDIIIVGGGASGLMFSTQLDKKLQVLLLEKNDRVGKKILATGNGRCNFCNKHLSEQNYYGDREFAMSVISQFTPRDSLKLFSDFGILTTCENDRYYPYTLSANTLLDCLRKKSEHIQTLTNFCVTDIQKIDSVFEVRGSETFYAKNVVIASGGIAGSVDNQDSYHLLTKFGHKLTNLTPSLVQLKSDTKNTKLLRNQRFNCTASFFDKGQEIHTETGEILFTEYGLSGNLIFNASSKIVERDFSDLKIVIDFYPDIEKQVLNNLITSRKSDFLFGICRNQLMQTIYKLSNDKNAYADILKNFEIKLYGTMGFKNAQVTKGGIACKDFDANTMQSRLQRGLYALGEVLNVDGDCGGYNLHFAFATASIASKALTKKQVKI